MTGRAVCRLEVGSCLCLRSRPPFVALAPIREFAVPDLMRVVSAMCKSTRTQSGLQRLCVPSARECLHGWVLERGC